MLGRWMRLVMVGGVILLAVRAAGAADAGQAPQPRKGQPAAAAAPAGSGVDRSASAEAHFELGEMHHRQVFETLDNAIKEYEEAIRQQAEFAEAHFNLGLAYHSKAKLGSDDAQLYRRALQEYKLYLRYRPNGELAAKAKQNIAAVEILLGEGPGKAPGAAKRGRSSKGSGGTR